MSPENTTDKNRFFVRVHKSRPETERPIPMSTPSADLAQHMARVELVEGLSRFGRADAVGNTVDLIANAFLAQNIFGRFFGRIAQQTGATELERHRVPLLGLARLHRRMPGSRADTPLCERILAAGGTEFCESREALLAGYLEHGRYLVLHLDVHACAAGDRDTGGLLVHGERVRCTKGMQCMGACASDGAGGVGDTSGLLVHPEAGECAECAEGMQCMGARAIGDTSGLLVHPEAVEYAEFMQRMREKPVGWSAAFEEACCYLPPDLPLPMRVEVVSWEDIELCAPEPPIPVERAGAPARTRSRHLRWQAGHFWTSLFQGGTMLQRNIQRIRALYAIVLVDLFDEGTLSQAECQALTGLQLAGTCERRVARQQLQDAIGACQVQPMNVGEHNYHACAEVYDEDRKCFVRLEPASSLFPHAELWHMRYDRRTLERLAPGIYAKLEPPQELSERMQAAVGALRAYLETAQASDDPDGPPIIFAGPMPLELHVNIFEEMQAAAFDGSCCMTLTRFLLAYMRAWGYRARASVGSLSVRLPGRETTLLYGTGRRQPENLRDVWDKLVARHADLCPERAAEVQQLLAKPIGLEDLWPKHLLRWARPVSHMLLPVVLPLRCEGCGGAGGKLMRCARCRLVHYCSRACQLAHHGTHGPACRRIVRAVRQMQESDAQLVSAPAQHAPANRRPCS